MKSTKQIEKETVIVSVQVTANDYYWHLFEAERRGYKNMSEYLRGLMDTVRKENQEAAE